MSTNNTQQITKNKNNRLSNREQYWWILKTQDWPQDALQNLQCITPFCTPNCWAQNSDYQSGESIPKLSCTWTTFSAIEWALCYIPPVQPRYMPTKSLENLVCKNIDNAYFATIVPIPDVCTRRTYNKNNHPTKHTVEKNQHDKAAHPILPFLYGLCHISSCNISKLLLKFSPIEAQLCFVIRFCSFSCCTQHKDTDKPKGFSSKKTLKDHLLEVQYNELHKLKDWELK